MKNDQPQFSVCVLTYKNLALLQSTIASVASQKDVRIELIISDDHTYSDCKKTLQYLKAVVSRYEGSFEGVKLFVNEKNLGTVKHLNRVLQYAEGQFLCLLGSGDCLFRPETLHEVFSYFSANSEPVCFRKHGSFSQTAAILCSRRKKS